MKVLIVTREYPPYNWAGGGKVVEYITNFFPRYGIKLAIVANHPKLKISKEIKENTIIYRVPTIGSTFLTKIPSFSYFASKLVKDLQKDYDLIYSHSSPLFCKIKKPFIVHFHGTRYGEYLACKQIKKNFYAFLNKLYISFDKILLEKAEGVIVLSQNMVEEIKKIGRVKDIAVIPNGVDIDFFKPLKEHQFNSLEKKVLFVGRLDARKGLDILFYAFKRLIKTIKAKLIIAGEGREMQKLTKLANKLSIPVDFLGRVPYLQLPQLYNEVDLFVLPSLYEAFPLAVLEAMASGTPVLVSDVVPVEGIPKFASGDVKSLSNLLLEILLSENKLKRLSQTCLEIAQKYTWEKVVFKMVEFLKKFK